MRPDRASTIPLWRPDRRPPCPRHRARRGGRKHCRKHRRRSPSPRRQNVRARGLEGPTIAPLHLPPPCHDHSRELPCPCGAGLPSASGGCPPRADGPPPCHPHELRSRGPATLAIAPSCTARGLLPACARPIPSTPVEASAAPTIPRKFRLRSFFLPRKSDTLVIFSIGETNIFCTREKDQ